MTRATTDPDAPEFGRRLAGLRAAAGLNVTDAAAAAGLRRPDYHYAEAGTRVLGAGRYLRAVDGLVARCPARTRAALRRAALAPLPDRG